MSSYDPDPPEPLKDQPPEWDPIQGACPICKRIGVLREEPKKGGIWCMACGVKLEKKDFEPNG